MILSFSKSPVHNEGTSIYVFIYMLINTYVMVIMILGECF